MKENLNLKTIEYLISLEIQFMQATRAKNIDINSESFRKELVTWLKERKNIGDLYRNLLAFMDLSQVSGPDTAEIGKGKYDSIVKPYDDTILITPYAKGLETIAKARLITANFKVQGYTPLLITPSGLIDFLPSFGLTFMTQNPYTPANIENWDNIHNIGDYNIIVGMYGSIYDKDKEAKIKELEAFRDQLDESINQEYCELDGSYCYVIASRRKVLKLEKNLHR